jgi:hypothetical protein
MPQDSKSIDDVLLEEFLDCCGGHIGYWLRFDPFGKIFDSYQHVLVVALSYGQGAYYVDATSLQWP